MKADKGIPGFSWPLAIVCGVLAALLFERVPPPAVLGAVSVASLACLSLRPLRTFAIAALALSATLFQFGERLADRLGGTHARAVVTVSGVIASVPANYPGLVRFRFTPEPGISEIPLPSALRVSWYHEDDDAPEIAVGERWRFELRLQPPWSRVNFSGADPERWLFANGYGALGTVRAAERLGGVESGPVDRARQRVVRSIRRNLDPGGGRGVVLALAVADRTELDAATRVLLTDTGTAHLLAISGLHVGLAAAAAFWLCRLLLAPVRRLHRGRALMVAAAVAGLACALGYALLADLGVSTLRAVAMVACVMAALVSMRQLHPGSTLLLAAAAVLSLDPFAPLGAGFWFSFGAVAALLAAFAPRASGGAWWSRPLRAQAAVMLVLLPVSAAWFGLSSTMALPANLLAIPWVSFLVVPPVLGGIAALPLEEGLATLSWQFAAQASTFLLVVLQWLAQQGPPPLGLNALDTGRLALALAGGLLLLLPCVFRWKWLGLFLLLPLVLPTRFVAGESAALLEVLDVGQGTAALLHAGSKSLAYDAGPGDGRSRHLVRSVILPALGTGAPDRIVISHGDLDHAGGRQGMVDHYPAAEVVVNSSRRGGASCETGWTWSWGRTRFRALHPSPGLPYLGNDSSCTLSVTGPAGRILLPGDISKPIEQRLLAEGLQAHDVLLVPHHGSASSSGAEFLDRVRPRVAIASAALGNRFGFPRAEVRERYRAAGIPLLTTGECGALRVVLRDGVVERVVSARRERARIWRWPAAPGCP